MELNFFMFQRFIEAKDALFMSMSYVVNLTSRISWPKLYLPLPLILCELLHQCAPPLHPILQANICQLFRNPNSLRMGNSRGLCVSFETSSWTNRDLASKYVTSSIVIPLARGCQKAVRTSAVVTGTAKILKGLFLEDISIRMTPYETEITGICAKALILDPRLKKCGFGAPHNAKYVVNQLIEEISHKKDDDSVLWLRTAKIKQ